MLIQDLMSSPVVSLLVHQTVPLAREIMAFRHIRHVPVVDACRRVVGLVTHRDLVRWADIAAEMRREGRDDLRVEAMMTRDVYVVHAAMAAAAVGRTLLKRKYGCAPVVDDDGRVVGIVTETDFLRIAIDALEARVTVRPVQLSA